MKVLVVGSGGREHALIWKLGQSPLVKELYAAPGNGGIAELARIVDINAEDVDALAEFAEDKDIDLTVVGPETPLAKGIVDEFENRRLRIFGPTKAGARLESSKSFTKQLLKKLNVPTPAFAVFDDATAARAYMKQSALPVVVKADGLCGGKGVIIATTQSEALGAIDLMMEDKIFKRAGERVVIEEFLPGEEASIFVLTDGKHAIPLAPAQDYKRLQDGDKGPNTGGMGAYSPAPVVTDEMMTRIMNSIILPVVQGLAKEGIRYKGVLYAGLMLTSEGPYVLEFNARFGDPELQVVLPRLRGDLAELMEACIDGKLDRVTLSWDARSAACVVLASGGYPGEYAIGKPIRGLDAVKKMEDVLCFHAGTKREGSQMVTWGGRALNVVALDDGIDGAVKRAYRAVEAIKFEGMQYRKDIAWRALKVGVKAKAGGSV
ncbi:MAG: phosphoribosylamine--glycine ligase [Candidatus Omnitrophica bacterium]|nr:phosphoribosylamine--glycine ligase [Candidatus Omnitrophota bacterium]